MFWRKDICQGFNGSFQIKSYFLLIDLMEFQMHIKNSSARHSKEICRLPNVIAVVEYFFCKWKEGNNKLLLRIKFTSRNAQYSLRLSVFLSFHFWQIIFQLTNRHEPTNHSTNLCRGKTWKLF